MPRPLVIAHHGELGLKGGNRASFARRLRDRLLEGIRSAGMDATVSSRGARYFVVLEGETRPEHARRAIDVVTRVPGVANAAAAFQTGADLDEIVHAATLALAQASDGTFKVETRRADKSFPLTSIETSQRLAPLLAERTGRTAQVRGPDVLVRVEILPGSTVVSAGLEPGPGGLPVGSSRRLLSFLSGGIDSAAATWQMLRRGARVTAVHFHNRTQQGQAVLDKIDDICGVLAWSAGRLPLVVVPFEACQRAIVAVVPARYRMLVYRRAMLRIGAALARRERALGFVVGDSLGQVASQTAENLRAIQAVATLPVYAPLIGSDKSEIVALARRIGTFEISIRPHADCCSFLLARHPATRSTPAELDEMEAGLDWDALVREAVARATRRLVSPDPAALRDAAPPPTPATAATPRA